MKMGKLGGTIGINGITVRRASDCVAVETEYGARCVSTGELNRCYRTGLR